MKFIVSSTNIVMGLVSFGISVNLRSSGANSVFVLSALFFGVVFTCIGLFVLPCKELDK